MKKRTKTDSAFCQYYALVLVLLIILNFALLGIYTLNQVTKLFPLDNGSRKLPIIYSKMKTDMF